MNNFDEKVRRAITYIERPNDVKMIYEAQIQLVNDQGEEVIVQGTGFTKEEAKKELLNYLNATL